MEKWDIHYLRHIRNILTVFAIAILVFVLKAGGEIIIPFVISVFIFLLVNPMLNKLDRLKVPNLLSIVTVLVIVVLVFVVFVYTVFQMVNTLLSRIGTYAERVAEFDAFISVYLARLFDRACLLVGAFAVEKPTQYGRFGRYDEVSSAVAVESESRDRTALCRAEVELLDDAYV